jgi:hypothetical protein
MDPHKGLLFANRDVQLAKIRLEKLSCDLLCIRKEV